MSDTDFNTYDFLINDEDEVMLLLYSRDGEPETPRIDIDYENKEAVLCRLPEDNVFLSDIPDEILDALQDADKLLVCELNHETSEEKIAIVHAYEAEITD